ncbi:MAG: PKD domain-containing protein, partial [Cyclobacteriaceae bacterium]|nr:PKD domain-containing protein [Cyclobacteriaceae bacterium]
VTSYDAQGRKKAVLDQKRNLIEKNEYQIVTQPAPSVRSTFTTATTTFIAGQPVVFVADDNCLPVSYQWKINGVNQGTGASLNYTFPLAGGYTVELTTMHATYGSSTSSQAICIERMYSPQLTVSGSTTFDCPDISKTFTASSIPPGCTATYQWWVLLESTGQWSLLTTVYSYNTATIAYGAQMSYTMKVLVTINCVGQVEVQCAEATQVIREASIEMTYAPTGGPC